MRKALIPFNKRKLQADMLAENPDFVIDPIPFVENEVLRGARVRYLTLVLNDAGLLDEMPWDEAVAAVGLVEDDIGFWIVDEQRTNEGCVYYHRGELV